jgi:hypothetical protein
MGWLSDYAAYCLLKCVTFAIGLPGEQATSADALITMRSRGRQEPANTLTWKDAQRV